MTGSRQLPEVLWPRAAQLAGEEGTQDDQELPDDRRAMSVAELGALTIVDALGFGPCSATT